MAEFLTTNGISYYIEKIIKEARTELYLFFPYLQISRELYELLKDSSERGVAIIIVYTSEDLYQEQKMMLGEIENLEIYNSENLNAKCCCSEEDVLFTSMDIHQLAANDSLEMGVIFNKNNDIDLYKKIYGEIKTVISSSKNMNLHKRPIEELAQPAVKTKKIYHGFCINCAMPVSYNIGNPYCRRCMPKSDSGADTSNEGGYCHLCGTAFPTNINSPLCDACRSRNI